MSRRGGKPIAPAAAAQPSVPAPSPGALAKAREIRAMRGAVVQIANALKARMMEVMWELRREFPRSDEGLERFGAFAAEHAGIPAHTAREWVATWDKARGNRDLRELARDAPDQAAALLQQLSEGDLLEAAAGEDPEVAELLTMPPRQRSKQIRTLIEARNAVGAGRHPDDVRRIEELEKRVESREMDEAGRDEAERLREAVAAVEEMRARLHDEAELLIGDLTAGGLLSARSRKRLLSALDGLIGEAEEISGAAMEDR